MEAGRATRCRRLDAQHKSPALPHGMRSETADPGEGDGSGRSIRQVIPGMDFLTAWISALPRCLVRRPVLFTG